MHTEPHVIGLVGYPGAGKTTVAHYLETKGFFRITLSDIIKEEAIKAGKHEFSREFLQEYGNFLRKTHGPQILTERALTKIRNGDAQQVVIDGIRNIHEIRFLKQQKNFVLIGIKTQPKERYQRLITTKGPKWTGSYDFFLKSEEKEKNLGSEDVGIRVEECFNEASHKIQNSKSKEDLYREIDAIIDTMSEQQKNPVYRIILLGVPGSGKGIQGELLANALHIPRLSVGALIRRHFEDKTPDGTEVGAYMLRGEAIPAINYIRMVTPWLLQYKDGFVVDNLVRTKEQLDSFRHFQKEHAFALTKVFCLRVPEMVAKQRLLVRRNIKVRPDETEESTHQRFITFEKSLGEIRIYFETLGIFQDINADRPPEVVHKEILHHLGLVTNV